ncbi:SGNH/GDSL hydrolase family protein [Fimbriimonas ginsengisoli]|uniref:SGNH hydrolase-type esterase domain-containing protein n=1 Tax=Fimbriimonas ginsengisoli Gsoil 348 TaxID=661478 RepID=A0A068NQ45_FIMGI|nr:SGNH/GDSL hydrolase family protein [Fimbriimonas ginsengisoli]AIE85673.1 hypothetical protein OP10G_2305 [Fimbriimonas ginsengisoli Gsoil 348]
MTYLALGDSISIDDYTGSKGGGAASQLARRLQADSFIDLTRDGAVSAGVLHELRVAATGSHLPKVDAVTLTIGGNDLLSGYFFREIGERRSEVVGIGPLRENLVAIAELLRQLNCPVVLNTIYDPTDGDDARAVDIGLPMEARQALVAANNLICETAERYGFLLCDLEELFHGHGFWSQTPWIVMHIEPNLLGAAQIARAWHQLLTA